jgi:ABC-type dipeptide/oligopeptide/nickel transport system permease subunit
MTAVELAGEARATSARRAFRGAFAALWAHPRGRIGLILVAAMTVLAALGPELAPWSFQELDLASQRANSNQPLLPLQDMSHLLGTDILSRDLLSRVLHGIRVSLLVALIAQAVIVAIGLPIGAIAGWFGGRLETLLMRATDVVATFPQLVFIIMFTVAFYDTPFQRTLDGLLVVMLAIGLLSWVVVARLVRAEVLSLKQRSYVEGARAIGLPGMAILRRHLMPNLMGSVVVAVSAGVPAAILTEATLSFLGLGIQPPSPSLGSLIWTGTETLPQHPHLVIVPAVPLVLLLVAFTLLGDGLRDVLDPRLRR